MRILRADRQPALVSIGFSRSIEARLRVTRLQQMSRANKLRFHMRDGPGQQARDAEWARAGDRSPDALRWLYEFDAGKIEPATA